MHEYGIKNLTIDRDGAKGLSADMSEVTMNLDGVRLKANALQLDAIIEGLVAARAQLLPAIPNDPPLGQRVAAIADPRYWTNIDLASGMTLLMFRHSGLGWMSFTLPPAERDRLAQYLTEQADAPAVPVATPTGPAVGGFNRSSQH